IEKEEALRRHNLARAREHLAKRNLAPLRRKNMHPLPSQLVLGGAQCGGLNLPVDDLAVRRSDPKNKFGHGYLAARLLRRPTTRKRFNFLNVPAAERQKADGGRQKAEGRR